MSVIFSSAVAEEIAKRFEVDEVFTYSTLSDAIGFGVRLGYQVVKRDVPLIEVYAYRSIGDLVMNVFSELAREVKKQYQDKIEKLGLSPEDEPKTINRFAAIAQEMKENQ